MINLTPHISGWTTNFWTLQKKILMHNISMFNKNMHQDMKNLVYKKGIIYNE